MYNNGELDVRLSRNEAIGNYVDAQARLEIRTFYRENGITFGRHSQVRVNNRDYNTAEGTYRIPDVGVGNVRFDMTIAPKSASTPQIRGFFAADARPVAVFIVRPTVIGGSYWIARTDVPARGN